MATRSVPSSALVADPSTEIALPSSSTKARQRRIDVRRKTNRNVSSIMKHLDKDQSDFDNSSVYEGIDSEDDSWSTASSTNKNKPNKSAEKKRKASNISPTTTLPDDPISETTDLIHLSQIRGIKKQARYEPVIPMSNKAELAKWRKEARRIRNRESAAASRNKTRLHIDELENKLLLLQNHYDTAVQRIKELETQLLATSESNHISKTNQISPILPPKPSKTIHDEFYITPTLSDHDSKLYNWSTNHQDAAERLANSLIDITSTSPPTTIANQDLYHNSSPSTSFMAPLSNNDHNIIPKPPLSFTNNNRSSTIPISGCTTTEKNMIQNQKNIMNSRPTAVCVVSI